MRTSVCCLGLCAAIIHASFHALQRTRWVYFFSFSLCYLVSYRKKLSSKLQQLLSSWTAVKLKLLKCHTMWDVCVCEWVFSQNRWNTNRLIANVHSHRPHIKRICGNLPITFQFHFSNTIAVMCFTLNFKPIEVFCIWKYFESQFILWLIIHFIHLINGNSKLQINISLNLHMFIAYRYKQWDQIPTHMLLIHHKQICTVQIRI